MSDTVHKANKLYPDSQFTYIDKWLARKKFRLGDLMLIVLCLSSAAISIILFRNDMFRTFTSYDKKKPIGTISIKNNNVQRRLGDRLLWGRLAVESPLYLEDLVRVAELSAATLNIAGNQINLDENTLIRVQQDMSNDGAFQIELEQGSMDISTEGTGISLKIMGKQAWFEPGTIFNAAAGEDGLKVTIIEGNAIIIDVEKNQTYELSRGTMLAIDSYGMEKNEPAVVVMRPRPNARYLNSDSGLLDVSFTWNRINLEAADSLSLEIAGDRNYNDIVQRITISGNDIQSALGNGIWYWRISCSDNILSSGQITVIDSSGPVLLAPIENYVYHCQTEKPQLRFLWEEIADAVSYIFEASESPDFIHLEIFKQTAITSFADSSLGPGTWYWRVKPVFPSVYEGSPAFSSPASFRIEQNDAVVELAWPEPVVAAALPEEIPIEVPAVAPPPVVRSPPVTPPPIVRSSSVVQSPPAALPPIEISPPAAQPPPLLSSPENRLPPDGWRIGIEELRKSRSIDFQWSAVPGANAYIFILFRLSEGDRQEIIRRTPENSTVWTLDNIGRLERGTYIWQIEAVNRNRDGTLERRGIPEENSFILDIPFPGTPTVQVEQTPHEN